MASLYTHNLCGFSPETFSLHLHVAVHTVQWNCRIVPLRKFDRIPGTSSVTFPIFYYVAPREICVEINLLPLDGAAYLNY